MKPRFDLEKLASETLSDCQELGLDTKTLNLDLPDATSAINKAAKKLKLEFHPDKVSEEEKAKNRFGKICDAQTSLLKFIEPVKVESAEDKIQNKIKEVRAKQAELETLQKGAEDMANSLNTSEEDKIADPHAPAKYKWVVHGKIEHAKAQLWKAKTTLNNAILEGERERDILFSRQEDNEMNAKSREKQLLREIEDCKEDIQADAFKIQYRELCRKDTWEFLKSDFLKSRATLATNRLINEIKSHALKEPKGRTARAWNLSELAWKVQGIEAKPILEIRKQIEESALRFQKIGADLTIQFNTAKQATAEKIKLLEQAVKLANEDLHEWEEKQRQIAVTESNIEILADKIQAKKTQLEQLEVELKELGYEPKSPVRSSIYANTTTAASAALEPEVKLVLPEAAEDEFIIDKKMDAFKRIYKALRDGQTSFFKTNFMKNKELLSNADLFTLVKKHAADKPNSRTAKALAMAELHPGEKCDVDNYNLFREIYKWSFAKSRILKKSKISKMTFYKSGSLNKNTAAISDEDILHKRENPNANTRSGKILNALQPPKAATTAFKI